jgi:hypothetical protein
VITRSLTAVALGAQVPATYDTAREAFQLVDTDADTYVTLDEFRAAAALFGIELTDAQVASFQALAREWGPGGNDDAVCFTEWVSTIDRVDFDGECYQSPQTPFWLGTILCYE